jgi:hypothetical protein
MTNQQIENEIAEILIKPSNEIKTGRFEENAEAASCNGNCGTGTCKGLV